MFNFFCLIFMNANWKQKKTTTHSWWTQNVPCSKQNQAICNTSFFFAFTQVHFFSVNQFFFLPLLHASLECHEYRKKLIPRAFACISSRMLITTVDRCSIFSPQFLPSKEETYQHWQILPQKKYKKRKEPHGWKLATHKISCRRCILLIHLDDAPLGRRTRRVKKGKNYINRGISGRQQQERPRGGMRGVEVKKSL